MPQEYTVKQVLKDETWDGNDDRMRTVELALDGHGSAVKLIGKAKFNAPAAGDKLFGEIDGDRFRPRKRPEGSQNGASGQGTDEYARRPEHPENAARMGYAKALELTPTWYELLRTEGHIEKPVGAKEATAKLVQIADFIAAKISEAGESTKSAPEPEPVAAQSDDLPF